MSLRLVIHGFLSIQFMLGCKVTRYVDASVLSAPDALLAIPAPPVPRRESLLVKL